MDTAVDNKPVTSDPGATPVMSYQSALALATLHCEPLKNLEPIKYMDTHQAFMVLGVLETIFVTADKSTDSTFGALNVLLGEAALIASNPSYEPKTRTIDADLQMRVLTNLVVTHLKRLLPAGLADSYASAVNPTIAGLMQSTPAPTVHDIYSGIKKAFCAPTDDVLAAFDAEIAKTLADTDPQSTLASIRHRLLFYGKRALITCAPVSDGEQVRKTLHEMRHNAKFELFISHIVVLADDKRPTTLAQLMAEFVRHTDRDPRTRERMKSTIDGNHHGYAALSTRASSPAGGARRAGSRSSSPLPSTTGAAARQSTTTAAAGEHGGGGGGMSDDERAKLIRETKVNIYELNRISRNNKFCAHCIREGHVIVECHVLHKQLKADGWTAPVKAPRPATPPPDKTGRGGGRGSRRTKTP